MPDWDDLYYLDTLSLGSYGGLDDRTKRRKKKFPIGFQIPKQPAKRTTKPVTKAKKKR